MLGWTDIRQRYRRALIGPFWLTISMGAMVGGMGLVYGTLFQQDLTVFLPYVAAGFLGWQLISSSIGDGATPFILAEGLIKQGGLPLSLHVFRTVWRNFLIFLHNSVVMLVIYILIHKFDPISLVLVIPGLALNLLNLTWMLLLIGPLCTRFRDFSPIIANVMQLMFFITPIVFHPAALMKIGWIVYCNPWYYMVEAIRDPLLGQGLPLDIVVPLTLEAIIGWIAAILFFARVRGRIAFWI